MVADYRYLDRILLALCIAGNSVKSFKGDVIERDAADVAGVSFCGTSLIVNGTLDAECIGLSRQRGGIVPVQFCKGVARGLALAVVAVIGQSGDVACYLQVFG